MNPGSMMAMNGMSGGKAFTDTGSAISGGGSLNNNLIGSKNYYGNSTPGYASFLNTSSNSQSPVLLIMMAGFIGLGAIMLKKGR